MAAITLIGNKEARKSNLRPRMTKAEVKSYWNSVPCGTRNIPLADGPELVENFEKIERQRYQLEPFIFRYAQFEKWVGKKILEVGCGIGTDLLQFTKAGAKTTAIDLSPQSASLAKLRLQSYEYQGDVLIGDTENLPFRDNAFDLVYSWGVLHHTPNPDKAVHEIYRVTKPQGEICVMVYHRHSLVALQLYLLFGLFAFKPLRSLKEIIANHLESPGTKAYSRAEVQRMFAMFNDLKIETVVTPYDLRYKRDKYLPKWVGAFIPRHAGWYMVIQGRKL